MKVTLETLPNEVLHLAFSYLSWFEMVTSLWSLNRRFDFLISSILSANNNQRPDGITFTQPGLSFNECCSRLFPLIFKTSSPHLPSCIRRIHFDGKNSNSSDLIHEWLFDINIPNNRNILRFPNLKSLVFTGCLLIESLCETLKLLIEHQLDELTLTFDQDTFELDRYLDVPCVIESVKEKLLIMLKQLLNKLFSAQCRLISLRLDIADGDTHIGIHQCLSSDYNLSSSSIENAFASACITLRHLHVRLRYTNFLHDFVDHVPALERLSIHFQYSLEIDPRPKLKIEDIIKTNGNWFHKMPKLQCFILKTSIDNDLEFAYLKWILNNLNHIQKLKVHLRSNEICRNDTIIWNSIVDANFVYQYCLPDVTANLIDFHFYIHLKSQFLVDNVEIITNSFKIHHFFIAHQWINVTCFFDCVTCYQHLCSSIFDPPRIFDGLINYPIFVDWPRVQSIEINMHPLVCLFLKRLEEIFPKVSSIKIHLGYNMITADADHLISLEAPFKLEQPKLNDIQFRYVTRLDFSFHLSRHYRRPKEPINRVKARANVLAHLISMPIQLKELRIQEFEWLLHVVHHASSRLKSNALNTVRYVEFRLPSCHRGSNTSIHIGKELVPFLSIYMPCLQTLCLWRPDDFPWTSIRSDFKPGYFYQVSLRHWFESLRTPESIAQHVTILEQNLRDLVECLKEFVFLDIHGKIDCEKVEPYRSIVQNCFPTSRSYVELSRFRLWL